MAGKYAEKQNLQNVNPSGIVRCKIADGFLAGLKAGRPKWHDLEKDPNDLPKESCSVFVIYEYESKTYRDNYINDKEHNIIGWESEYKDPYCAPQVIAWCEIPTFDKE